MSELIRLIILALVIGNYDSKISASQADQMEDQMPFDYAVDAQPGTDSDLSHAQSKARSLWFSAAIEGDLATLKKLLAKAVDINMQDEFGNTALIYATNNGQTQIIEFLFLVPELNINLQNKWGTSALILAVDQNNENIAIQLAQFPGVKINAQNSDGMTALMVGALKGNNNIIKSLLSIDKIDINMQSTSGGNALMCAAASGHEDTVKLLLASKYIDINVQDKPGRTALIYAADNDHANIVSLLLNQPAISVNKQDNEGRTALMWASENGSKRIVKLLLSKPEINYNINDRHGNNALSDAAYGGHEQIVKLLLALPGININTQNKSGVTALKAAACHGYRGIVQLLLTMPGIHINTQDNEGNTALAGAIEGNYDSTAQIIKKKIAELTGQAFDAICRHELDTLKQTVAQIGLDNIADDSGNTLLDKAFEVNCPAIIEFLLQQAKDPQEALARFPFEHVNPTTDTFRYFLDLAYGTQPKFIAPGVSTKKRKCATLGAQSFGSLSKQCDLAHATTNGKQGHAAKQTNMQLESDLNARACAHCKNHDCINRCSLCRLVYYCSETCQKANWRVHKHNCKKNSH